MQKEGVLPLSQVIQNEAGDFVGLKGKASGCKR